MTLALIIFPMLAILGALGVLLSLPRAEVPASFVVAVRFVACATAAVGFLCAGLSWLGWAP